MENTQEKILEKTFEEVVEQKYQNLFGGSSMIKLKIQEKEEEKRKEKQNAFERFFEDSYNELKKKFSSEENEKKEKKTKKKEKKNKKDKKDETNKNLEELKEKGEILYEQCREAAHDMINEFADFMVDKFGKDQGEDWWEDDTDENIDKFEIKKSSEYQRKIFNEDKSLDMIHEIAGHHLKKTESYTQQTQ